MDTTVTPVLVGELRAAGDGMPIYIHVIDHPEGRVLVDTGLTDLHSAVADLDPHLRPVADWRAEVGDVDIVVNTHLHFDHCGGNRVFAGTPIHVQRQELEDARELPDYTIREWVDAPGLTYRAVDGEFELLPGIRLLPAPGHTRGSQIVVVGTREHPVVVAGDTAVWHGELDQPTTQGQKLIRSIHPSLVWLSHAHDAWRP